MLQPVVVVQAALVPARRVPRGHLQQGAGHLQGRGAGQRARPQLQRRLVRLEGAGEVCVSRRAALRQRSAC